MNELTPRQAAAQCGVSIRTMRRWLTAGELDGAHRDAEGHWQIPPTAIVGRLKPSKPEQPELPELNATRDELGQVRDELNATRLELATERANREALELVANERLDRVRSAERRADVAERNLHELIGKMPQLGPGPATPTPAPTPAEPTEHPRRRWWNRGA